MAVLSRRDLLQLVGINAAAAFYTDQSLAVSRWGDNEHRVSPGAKSSDTTCQEIARFIANARRATIPTDVIRKAKEQITYHIGLACSGWNSREAQVMRTVLEGDAGRPAGATVIGDHLRLDYTEAAFANCVLMRAQWLDDVVWPAGIHAGLMTLPTAFALAELNHCSGRELLRSVILGYEVLGKLGRAANSWASPLPRRPTMIFGAFGPVTVGSTLLELDEAVTANALGYAANLGMGVPEGGQTDHYYGLLCRNGTFAVQLAVDGGIPYSDVTIEGPTGLYRSYFGVLPAELPGLIELLGTGWEILGASQKRYPGTSQNTVATELFLELVKEQGLSAADVHLINVFVSSADDSDERKKELSSRGPFASWMDAYSSLPYALAVALVDGTIDFERFRDDRVNDDAIAAVMNRISLTFEPGHGEGRYCRLEIRTADGRAYLRDTNTSDISEDFTFSLPQSEWRDWIGRHCHQRLSCAQMQALEEKLINLEAIDDFSEVMQSVRREA